MNRYWENTLTFVGLSGFVRVKDLAVEAKARELGIQFVDAACSSRVTAPNRTVGTPELETWDWDKHGQWKNGPKMKNQQKKNILDSYLCSSLSATNQESLGKHFNQNMMGWHYMAFYIILHYITLPAVLRAKTGGYTVNYRYNYARIKGKVSIYPDYLYV